MISEYQDKTYSDISSEDELSLSASDKEEHPARGQRTVSEQIKEEIRLFTEQLLSKREEQFLACLTRIDKSLAGIQLQMKPAVDNKKKADQLDGQSAGQFTDQFADQSAGQSAVISSTHKPTATAPKGLSGQPDYQIYKGLPIPLLTPERDYKKWFDLYEQVMATKDERILKHALVYYLDDDVLDLYVEISAKTYRNLKRSLYEKIKELEFYDG